MGKASTLPALTRAKPAAKAWAGRSVEAVLALLRALRRGGRCEVGAPENRIRLADCSSVSSVSSARAAGGEREMLRLVEVAVASSRRCGEAPRLGRTGEAERERSSPRGAARTSAAGDRGVSARLPNSAPAALAFAACCLGLGGEAEDATGAAGLPGLWPRGDCAPGRLPPMDSRIGGDGERLRSSEFEPRAPSRAGLELPAAS